MRGELVRTLVDGKLEAGAYDFGWDGRDRSGAQAASGVYFYEARADGQSKIAKMTLVK